MSNITPNEIDKQHLQTIMKTIETSTEQKIIELNLAGKIITNSREKSKEHSETLLKIMSTGADEFKQKTGRNMTYSEMRSMYG